jgi:hypothetical protein
MSTQTSPCSEIDKFFCLTTYVSRHLSTACTPLPSRESHHPQKTTHSHLSRSKSPSLSPSHPHFGNLHTAPIAAAASTPNPQATNRYFWARPGIHGLRSAVAPPLVMKLPMGCWWLTSMSEARKCVMRRVRAEARVRRRVRRAR